MMGAICQSCGAEGTERCVQCRRPLCDGCVNPCTSCRADAEMNGKDLRRFPALDRPCHVCADRGGGGETVYVTGAPRPACHKCLGRGRVPTPVGQRLLDFVRRHS